MFYYDETITANTVLEKMNHFVTIKQQEMYVHHYQTIVDFVLDEMKENNSLFRSLYNGYSLVGSYPDRLKVTRPDEFDVNIRLKFKQDYDLVQVTPSPRQPGFCNINLRKCRNIIDNNQVKKLLDDEGYLLQDKVNTWMHKIFKNILRKYIKRDDVYIIEFEDYSYKLSFSLSGPAYTLKLIVLSSHIKFSVDLAIGFVFDNNKWIAYRKFPRTNRKIEWYAVPKPIPSNSKSNRTANYSNSRSFICSYSDLERTYMYDLNAMKCMIRLFKKLRDTQNLTNLISYHIKTVFLWEINKNPKAFWEQSLIDLFLDMFEKMLDVYQSKRLPSFWDPAYNLLGKFDKSTLSELELQLRRIYTKVLRNEEDNPEYMINVFLTSGEIKEYHRRRGLE